jgi:uncharacterized protein YkwD
MNRGVFAETKVLSRLTTEVTMTRNRNLAVLCIALTALAYLAVLGTAGGSASAAGDASLRVTTARHGVSLNENERALLALINRARTRRGLKALVLSASLCRAAKAHSQEMIGRDYFSHLSAGGLTPQNRARRAGYSTSGYSGWAVGEVIAWGSSVNGLADVVFRRWMGSAGHRAILLGRQWRDVGVGRAGGTYRGLSGVSMYTVDVGRRTR